MDLVMVIIRTVFFYVFVLIIFRLMGKREIGELSIQDLVVSLLIAELVAISIENYKDSMLLTVIPILILLFFEIAAGYFSLRFNKFRNLVDGKPAEYTYQWYVNNSAVSGATSSTYTKTGLTSVDTYSVYCNVTNKAGTVKSRVATLAVKSTKPIYTYSGNSTLIDDGFL